VSTQKIKGTMMLYPMAMMVLLILLVGIAAIRTRFASVKSGAASVKDFRLTKKEDLPDSVIKTTRCFNNLFEIPMIFYIVCTLYISLQIDSAAAIILAWLFVVFRYIHVYIMLGNNNVIHRMWAFWIAFVCVLGLWGILLVKA
jgi:hypothetical protein